MISGQTRKEERPEGEIELSPSTTTTSYLSAAQGFHAL